jgi:hypothetical protein
MDSFADIRPYNDDEVPAVLERLLSDPELLAAITSLKFKSLATPLGFILRPLVGWYLRRQMAGVTDVDGFQQVISGYMTSMIEDSTAGFSSSGLDRLTPSQAYLFMSNHRDIALDPAFTNMALHQAGRRTVRIAIGDNLLTKPYVSDLMRINKSFIVNRSATAPRKVLAAYRALSAYIRHSICVENAPIWIAQREGRAKDGVDRTEPAIIKMLAMSQDKKTESFAEAMAALHIVPVSISYELDPCDGLKAAELFQIAAQGSYEKAEQEDVASIATGIAGDKGLVHVAFGTPLAAELENPDEIAAALDAQVIANYRLHKTNVWAYLSLHGEDAPLPEGAQEAATSCTQEQFRQRIDSLPPEHRDYALGIYANSVVSLLAARDAVRESAG